jgi:glutaredoxin
MPKEYTVIMITKNGCPACSQAKSYIKTLKKDSNKMKKLDRIGIDINDIEILDVDKQINSIPDYIRYMTKYVPLIIMIPTKIWKRSLKKYKNFVPKVNDMNIYNGKLVNYKCKAIDEYDFSSEGIYRWLKDSI